MASVTVPVVSVIPNLVKALQLMVPSLTFKHIDTQNADDVLNKSEIIIADFDLIGPYLYTTKARWIQGTWAGTNALYDHLKPSPPNCIITRFTGDSFGFLMSEYVITHIVNFERDIFKVRENQKNLNWSKNNKINDYRAIKDLTIGVLGLGNIGLRISQNVHVLGGTIYGYGRKPSIDLKKYNYISKYFTKNNLPELLKSCDYLINVMPNTNETTGLLDDNILENCKEKSTIFINIGRGNIVTENSLLEAIKNKWLGGAILDVFQKEPLPEQSPLWKIENVIITPHVSGTSRAKDIAEHFRDNYNKYINKQELPAVIDFSKGY